MKVFLSADMEGTCGIVSWPETERFPSMWDCDTIYRVRLNSKERFKSGRFVITVE